MSTIRASRVFHRPTTPARAAGLAVLVWLLASPAAFAQYKVVGPDGKITYTDRPPVGTKAQPVSGGAAHASMPSTNVPYELRPVVSRFPVTLYTSANCAPCDSGRALLKQRGIPFAERTVSSPDDQAMLKRNEGIESVPLLRIGGQQIKGFSADEWNSYLSTAGYPEQSKLPSSYTHPAPTPLAPRAAASGAEGEPSAPATPSVAPPATGSSPSRFRF